MHTAHPAQQDTRQSPRATTHAPIHPSIEHTSQPSTVHHPGAGATIHTSTTDLTFPFARAQKRRHPAMSSKPSSPKGKGAEVAAAAAPSPDGAKAAAHTGGGQGSPKNPASSTPSSPAAAAAADQSHDPADGPTNTQIPYVCASASFFLFIVCLSVRSVLLQPASLGLWSGGGRMLRVCRVFVNACAYVCAAGWVRCLLCSASTHPPSSMTDASRQSVFQSGSTRDIL